MSWVSVRSLSVRSLSRSCAAPLMPGERVLDLVGEHGGKSGDRARGAAMGELTLDHLRHAALLQHDQHASGHFRQRSAVEIDQLRRLEPERAEIDAIFVDRGSVSLHLLDESDERSNRRRRRR